jgi:hypothetical protein
MDDDAVDKDWKLKLRYGQLQTPFKHYTAIAKASSASWVRGFLAARGTPSWR